MILSHIFVILIDVYILFIDSFTYVYVKCIKVLHFYEMYIESTGLLKQHLE